MIAEFSIIGKDRLREVKPLWVKLNEFHKQRSLHFKDHYESNSFQARCEKVSALPDDKLRIEIVTISGKIIGYCIASIDAGVGEIDSLYVEHESRNRGYGAKLIEHSLSWLRAGDCYKIIVAVANGNEAAISYYERWGFYPKTTILQSRE